MRSLSSIFLLFLPFFSTGQIIKTFAGNGIAGSTGNGGPATAARVNTPVGVCIDTIGNVYFAEYNGHIIRKVDTFGVISTYAGTGVPGLSGNGGPATAAQFNVPWNIAMDKFGNMFVVEQANNVIRKISPSGIITAYAGTGVIGYSGDGGPATNATFNKPSDIAVDDTGNIYFGDGYNVIRKVSVSGIITTFAGTGAAGYSGDGGPALSARLNNPISVVWGHHGLYIGDNLNNRIRLVNPAGIISTVAGNGTAGYSGDGGPPLAAQISGPLGLAIDGGGILYESDYTNNVIRRISPTTIETIAGNGTAGFSGDGGNPLLAMMSRPWGIEIRNNRVYFADVSNNRVRDILPCPAVITGNPWTCVGGTITLSSSSVGTWSSGSNTIATVGATTGVVTALMPGQAVITCYLATGCQATVTFVVMPNSTTISGNTTICVGSTTTLSSPSAGTWTSSVPGVANIFSSGVVTGISPGMTIITRLLPIGPAGVCLPTVTVTVNPIPSIISGNLFVCTGLTTPLSNSVGGGTWSSSAPFVATIGAGGLVTGVTAGTAVITYIIAGGCFKTATVTVSNTPGTITGNTAICAGTTTAMSNAVGGGTWVSASPGIGTISASGIFTGVTAGAAVISYSLGVGCFDTATITVFAAPSAISGVLSICMGATSTLSNTVSGGTWTSSNTGVATVIPNGVGNGTVTSVAVGTSVISYTLSSGCAKSVTITVNPMPTAITGATSVCSGLTTALSNTIGGGTWSSAATSFATISASGVVTGVAAGTAIISYTISPGCFDTAVITVYTSPTAIAGPTAVCEGQTILLSDGVAGGTWSSSNTAAATVVSSGAGAGTITGLATGTSIISYTLPSGCAKSMTITVNTTPDAITGTTTVCSGFTTALSNATIGGTWSSASVSTAIISISGIVSGMNAGTAIVSYTTSAGCYDTTEITVYATPVPIAGPSTICLGKTIVLSDATAGGTWSSSNTSVATIISSGAGEGTVTSVATGTAVISYTMPSGCAVSTIITVNQAPDIITGITNVCTGYTTALSNTVSGGIWSAVTTAVATVTAGTGVVKGITPGTSVISYSIGTCAVTTTVAVSLSPSIISGTPNICTDGTAMLSSTPGGGVWSSSNTNIATIIATSPTSATVTGITDGVTVITYTLSGCVSITTITAVSVLPNITGPALVCTGRSILLSNSIIGGTWSSSNTNVTVTPTPGYVSGITPGVANITYSLGGSCVITTSVTIAPTPDAGVIIGPSDLCVGATIALTDAAGGGTWSTSNTAATVANGIVTGIASGTVTIRYVVSNSSCIDTALKMITIHPIPDVGAMYGPTVVCAGSSIALSNPVTGGTWSSVSTNIATMTITGVFTGISAGTDTIRYIVNNPGCSDTLIDVITVYNIPDAGVITGIAKVCKGSSFTMSSSIAGGEWSSSNTNIAIVYNPSGTVEANEAGVVTITYTSAPNAGGCKGVATFTLTVIPKAEFTTDTAVSQIMCYGDNNGSIAVSVTGSISPLEYSWSNDSVTASISGLAPGTYILTIYEAATLCRSKDTFIIRQPDSFYLSAQVTTDLCSTGAGGITTAVAGGTTPYAFLWSNNSTAANLEHVHGGNYTLTVTDMNSCIITYSATVGDTCHTLIIHDAITPNGDGINDAWVIEGIQGYPASTVQVFDKWGDLVFEKTNYNNDWNGSGKRTSLLPDGTYFYLVKLNATNVTGGENTFTGTILIKR